MFGTFRVGKFDKPLIMTIVFGVTGFCAIFFLFSQGLSTVNLLLAFSLLNVVPMAAGLYRCYNMRSWKELPGLFFLYSVYFMARLHALFLLIGKRG
jgi:fatty-acid desaturase